MNDEGLLLLIRARNKRGAECLYDRYAAFIKLILMRYIKGNKRIELLLIEILLEIINQIDEFDPTKEGMASWIKRITLAKVDSCR